MEIKPNKKLESEIISLIENASGGNNNMEKIIKLLKNNKLTDESYKKILELAFEKKGAGLIEKICDNISFEPEKNYINHLIELGINNTSKNPINVFNFLLVKFPKEMIKIDLNNIINKDSLVNLFKTAITAKNESLKRYFVKQLNENNLEILRNNLSSEDKNYLLYSVAKYSNNIDFFKEIYSECKLSNYDIIKNTNSEFKGGDIINYIIENSAKDDVTKLLRENVIDVELINKIMLKMPQFSEIFEANNSLITSFYDYKQGKGQVKIKVRKVNYHNNGTQLLIKTIEDEFYTNLKNGTHNERLLYRVAYRDNGTQQITYYEDNGKTKLAIIAIDENGTLEFKSGEDEEKATYDLDKIRNILEYNYKNVDGFDYRLSFLSYILLRNRLDENKKKNIIFKTNFRTINDVVENIEKQEKEKIFIYDFGIDKHNVQVVAKDNNINILNTGFNFGYIVAEIKQELSEATIKQVRIINQSCGNCVEASKLYTVVLAEKYKQHFGSLEKLSERLGRFEEIVENTLNIKDENGQIKYLKEEYNKGSTKEENNEMIKIILETNIELLEKHKKYFLIMGDSIKSFYNIVTKIDLTLNNETKKMYDMVNIIGLGNEINYLQNQKNNNNRYNKFTENVIKFYEVNSDIKEKDENLNNKLDKGEKLLEFIKNGITGFNELDEQQKQIFENINKKIDSGGENVFEECLEEFNKLKSSEIEF